MTGGKLLILFLLTALSSFGHSVVLTSGGTNGAIKGQADYIQVSGSYFIITEVQ